MTTKDLAGYLGRTGLLSVDSMQVDVTILDARHAYGRLDYQITPRCGSGVKWVHSESVVLKAEEKAAKGK
jgi:hypothetical protein